MKKYQIAILTILGIVLIAVGFLAWFCTGSFEYQSSMRKEFLIDAPVSVVCKRALNAKSIPESEDGTQTKVDVQEAVKNVTLGEPIEVEIDHPKFGKIAAKIQITFEITGTSIKINGEVAELDPNHFEKCGKALADVERFSFSLGIIAKDAQPAGLLQLLPSTGTTMIEVASASKLKIYFREMGFVRSQVDREIAKAQQKILTQIETFVDENLRQPTEEELAEQKNPAKKDKKKKKWFWKKTEVEQEETENLDAEGIDFSALDEGL